MTNHRAMKKETKEVETQKAPPTAMVGLSSEIETEKRIKHPLERSWSLWFYSNASQNWEDNQVKITSFDTVEDFWCLFHHMKLPSELEQGQDYAVFQKGIRPMWEDAANKRGGRLLITVDRRNWDDLDRIWIDTVLMTIGENFSDLNNLIRGVVINIRPKQNKTKIGIWLADKNKEKENIQIGKKLKEALQLPWRLVFYAHNSSSALYSA